MQNIWNQWNISCTAQPMMRYCMRWWNIKQHQFNISLTCNHRSHYTRDLYICMCIISMIYYVFTSGAGIDFLCTDFTFHQGNQNKAQGNSPVGNIPSAIRECRSFSIILEESEQMLSCAGRTGLSYETQTAIDLRKRPLHHTLWCGGVVVRCSSRCGVVVYCEVPESGDCGVVVVWRCGMVVWDGVCGGFTQSSAKYEIT